MSHPVPAPANAEERLLLAGFTARRIVAQCRAHAESVTKRLSDRINGAAATTPCGEDVAAGRRGSHGIALQERINTLESMSNALVVHLRGLEVLMNHKIFYALPTVPIVRALAEVASTCSWMLEPGLTADDRAARGYASLFRTIEQNQAQLKDTRATREWLVEVVTESGARIQRRVVAGKSTDEIGTVSVRRAHAKTAFKYHHRLEQQIPSISAMYSGMSAMAHGETTATGLAWNSTDVLLRMVAKVSLESTRAWSTAVHTWTGSELLADFINPIDEANIIKSMPPDQVVEFEALRQRNQPVYSPDVESNR